MFAAWLQGEECAWSGSLALESSCFSMQNLVPFHSFPSRDCTVDLALSNLAHFLRLRRLFGSAALALVVVGACTLPDYTFETPGAGGTLGGMGTTGNLVATSSDGAISTGSTSSDSSSVDTTST